MVRNDRPEEYYKRPAPACIRPKMEREDRAKQFAPFAALKGYPDALRKKEKIIVPKAELSEEAARLLDIKLRQIRKNDMVTVIYFCKGEYLRITGLVSRIDPAARILKIVNTNILLDDVLDVSGEGICTDMETGDDVLKYY